MKNEETPNKKLESSIAKEISNSDHPEDPRHSILAKKWVKKLDPKAPYHVQIAALAHDIDRARHSVKWKENTEKYNAFKKRHEARSAKIACEILRKHKYSLSFRRKVSHIIRNHEFGGNYETNLVRDADSLSFFENNIKYMIKRHPDSYTIKKCKWMFNRVDPKAREFIIRMKQPPAIKKLLKHVF